MRVQLSSRLSVILLTTIISHYSCSRSAPPTSLIEAPMHRQPSPVERAENLCQREGRDVFLALHNNGTFGELSRRTGIPVDRTVVAACCLLRHRLINEPSLETICY